MNIAWGYLTDLEIVQLLHFHPELRGEYERWKKGSPKEESE